MQKMQVVSVCLHYGNIIWFLVAMATSLDKLENKAQIHHLHIMRLHMVKDCENRSSTSEDICQNMPNHDVNMQHNFHLLACSLPKLLDGSSPKFYTM